MSQSLTKIKSRLEKKARRIQRFMSLELGSDVVQALADEFYDGELYSDDPIRTAYNLGRRDVVVYLKQLQKWRTEDE